MKQCQKKFTVPFPQQRSRECTQGYVIRYCTYIAYLVCNDYKFTRQAGWLRNRGFCLHHPEQVWEPTAFKFNGYQGFFPQG